MISSCPHEETMVTGHNRRRSQASSAIRRTKQIANSRKRNRPCCKDRAIQERRACQCHRDRAPRACDATVSDDKSLSRSGGGSWWVPDAAKKQRLPYGAPTIWSAQPPTSLLAPRRRDHDRAVVNRATSADLPRPSGTDCHIEVVRDKRRWACRKDRARHARQ